MRGLVWFWIPDQKSGGSQVSQSVSHCLVTHVRFAASFLRRHVPQSTTLLHFLPNFVRISVLFRKDYLLLVGKGGQDSSGGDGDTRTRIAGGTRGGESSSKHMDGCHKGWMDSYRAQIKTCRVDLKQDRIG